MALTLVDEWGRGFVAEVDYRTEARNTEEFSAAMKRRGLDAVVDPDTGRIIGAKNELGQLIEGRDLEQFQAGDDSDTCMQCERCRQSLIGTESSNYCWMQRNACATPTLAKVSLS